MPDKPIPDNDPMSSKSYAAHYMIADPADRPPCSGRCGTRPLGSGRGKHTSTNGNGVTRAFLNSARSKSDDLAERCRAAIRLSETETGP